MTGKFPVDNWNVPLSTTPDVFNSCSETKLNGIPENNFGISYPKSGKGYVGMVIYSGETSFSAEYIQTKLTVPMEKGSLYCVKLYYQLASKSVYSSNGLGVYLGQNKIKEPKRVELDLEPSYFLKNEEKEKGVWKEMCFEYKSGGNEEYLVIGRFTHNDTLKYTVFPNYKRDEIKKLPYAYFYIDDVSMTAKGEENCPCENEHKINTSKIDSIPINNYFYLSVDDSSMIKEVYRRLNLTPNMVLEIKGNKEEKKKIINELLNLGAEPHQLRFRDSYESLKVRFTMTINPQ